MFCKECGSQIPDDGAFCPTCGNKVAQVPVQQHVQQASAQQEPAHQAAAAEPAPAEIPAAPAKRKRRGLVIGVTAAAVVVAVAVGVGAWFAVSGGPSSLSDSPFQPFATQEDRIDSTQFPNAVIRDAVLAQVDADGDGVLSQAEASKITGVSFADDGSVVLVEEDDQAVAPETLAAMQITLPASASSGASGAGSSTNASSRGSSSTSSAQATAGAMSDASSGSASAATSDSISAAYELLGSSAAEMTPPPGASSLPPSSAQDASDRQGGAAALDQETIKAFGDAFPNLHSFVAVGQGLTSLDLSSMPELEFVDVRQNSIASLDLSNNRNITSLFCDPDVELTGLDEAGLYFTDLVAGASHETVATGQAQSYRVTYDGYGRLAQLTVDDDMTSTYTYRNGTGADRHQLVSVDGAIYENSGRADRLSTYEYDESGLLEAYISAKSILVNADTASKTTIPFTYDDQNRLVGTHDLESQGELALSYEGDSFLPSYLRCPRYGEDYWFTKYDDGKLTALTYDMDKVPYSGTTEYTFTYNDKGEAIRAERIHNGLLDIRTEDRFETSYDEAGLPKTSVFQEDEEVGMPARLVDARKLGFETNRDGYITAVDLSAGNQPAYKADRLEVAYVKFVGSLEDRPLRRYVPQIQMESTAIMETWPVLCENTWFTYNLDSTSMAENNAVSLNLYEPQQLALKVLGLQPCLVSNPNEVKLAAYDREHWLDGID